MYECYSIRDGNLIDDVKNISTVNGLDFGDRYIFADNDLVYEKMEDGTTKLKRGRTRTVGKKNIHTWMLVTKHGKTVPITRRSLRLAFSG